MYRPCDGWIDPALGAREEVMIDAGSVFLLCFTYIQTLLTSKDLPRLHIHLLFCVKFFYYILLYMNKRMWLHSVA